MKNKNRDISLCFLNISSVQTFSVVTLVNQTKLHTHTCIAHIQRFATSCNPKENR